MRILVALLMTGFCVPAAAQCVDWHDSTFGCAGANPISGFIDHGQISANDTQGHQYIGRSNRGYFDIERLPPPPTPPSSVVDYEAWQRENVSPALQLAPTKYDRILVEATELAENAEREARYARWSAEQSAQDAYLSNMRARLDAAQWQRELDASHRTQALAPTAGRADSATNGVVDTARQAAIPPGYWVDPLTNEMLPVSEQVPVRQVAHNLTIIPPLDLSHEGNAKPRQQKKKVCRIKDVMTDEEIAVCRAEAE